MRHDGQLTSSFATGNLVGPIVALVLGCAACGRPPAPPAAEPGEPAARAPANGLASLPACATTGSQVGGTSLLYPKRALPALVAPGDSIELRVRMARSLMPAPGVQRSRALWGWSIRMDARVVHALGVRDEDPAARRPAIRYTLPVLGVRADDSLSLVYRVRVEIPRGAVPATYDLTVRRPGATAREPLAIRVLAPGREARVVAGGALDRADLVDDLARWELGGADLVVVGPSAGHDHADAVTSRLAELEPASTMAVLVLPPDAGRPASAWADRVAATGFVYVLAGRSHAVGRCLDGRREPIVGSAGRDPRALSADGVGRLVDRGQPLRGPSRRPVAARDASGATVLDAGDPETSTEVLVGLRRGDRLQCTPARCRTLAIGVSPEPFAAPSDAATGIVVSLAPGAAVRLAAARATRRSLALDGPRTPVAAGVPFVLSARSPRGLEARRVLWSLVAPPSADWVLDEQPRAEGARMRHRVRAPGIHEFHALAVADDGSLASGGTTVEVTAAATSACTVGSPPGAGGPSSRARRSTDRSVGPGLLLVLVGSCLIGRRRRGLAP
ncbi:MAG: hypothetical protein IT379_08860 [Deltaproteobacteria bacterium]|nr:hypothetical protein [Deltaproteobacteria bacterium]